MYIHRFPTVLLLFVTFNCVLGVKPTEHFIVQFHSYRDEEFRRSEINSYLVGFSKHFTFVPRNYSFMKGMSISDFEIIEVHNLSEEGISDLVASLSLSKFIKRVFPDKPVRIDLSHMQFGKPLRNPDKQASPPGSVNLDRLNQPWRRLSTWEVAWSGGVCGEGVRVGIFDTGLVNTNYHSHFRNANVRGRSNWTWRIDKGSSRTDNNPLALDGHGHGTFVTGLIAAAPNEAASPATLTCPVPGLAPRAELHIFRVFTDNQLSMTSWFLDAFNYAIIKRLHVINLSNGGPDFMDQPFVEKVIELAAIGILLVSAIGNDGPVYGTLNNPADLANVLGVGGVDANGDIATFSSRGATAMEMQEGYGRFKPDIVGWATSIVSSNLDGGCKVLSGTSAASPVVTGSVALLISAALSENLPERPPINPASLKQAIIGGAVPLTNAQGKKLPMLEQGAGLLNLGNSIDIMRRLKPQASLWPSYLDFTECPHFWPYCSQPLYASGIPVIVNVTIINSMGVNGRVVDRPVFHPILSKVGGGAYLDVGVMCSNNLWPWTGYLALYISVLDTPEAAAFDGIAEGWISLKVESDDLLTQMARSTELKLPIRVPIIPTPKREKRILWDAFHNIRYPAAYVPADDLTKIASPLDWLGDHIHTNFHTLYQNLREAGYFLEVLQQPLTCFDASKYQTLMIVDPEEDFWPEEVSKLEKDIKERGLSVLVFGGWFNASVLSTLKFYDSNNKRLWVPITGGSNVPALNNLLSPFDIQFGDRIFGGELNVGIYKASYPSGSHLTAMPTTQGRSYVLPYRLVDLSSEILDRTASLNNKEYRSFDSKQKALFSNLRSNPLDTDPLVPVLGIWMDDPEFAASTGKITVFGDSVCLDSSAGSKSDCFWLVENLLDFAVTGKIEEPLASSLVPASQILTSKPVESLKPMEDSKFEQFSRVILHGGTGDSSPIYRPLRQCKADPPRALVAPVAMDKEIIYERQPLLLRPPLPLLEDKSLKMNISNYFQCHEPPSSSVNSIDRNFGSGSLNERDRLIREYIGFLLLATGIFLILLNYRAVLDWCSFRNITRRLRKLRRCLCGRPTGVQNQRLEMEEGDETAGRSPRQPRGYVVETVHTSLTYRLVRQCLQRQQRR